MFSRRRSGLNVVAWRGEDGARALTPQATIGKAGQDYLVLFPASIRDEDDDG